MQYLFIILYYFTDVRLFDYDYLINLASCNNHTVNTKLYD